MFRIKTGAVHKYLNSYSLKNYTPNYYKEALKLVDFWNYETFGDLNEAYSNVFQKLMDYWQNCSLEKQASEKKYSKIVIWQER